MWRVSQCCCGCSLKTGTLILLWLDVLNRSVVIVTILGALNTIELTQSNGYFVLLMLAFQVITLVISIFALVGAMTRRPSLMIPYIILYIMGLLLLVFLIILLLASLAWSDTMVDMIMESKKRHYAFTPDEKEMLRQRYRGSVIQSSLFLVLVFCLSYYFFCVIYSYYKEMKEQIAGTYSRGTGVVLSAPQGKSYSLSVQRPHSTAALYPQGHAGYPPIILPNRQKF